MTIQELYAEIDGNYAHALDIMRMDRLIDKHIRKLEKSGMGQALREACRTMDARAIFDRAHAMKGVCGNLGLDHLSEAAGEIAEEFREGNPRTLSDDEVRARVEDVCTRFDRAAEGIRKYAGEA